MSDGVEAIIKNTTRARETLDSSSTAPISVKTSRQPWGSILSDWGMGALIPAVTIVLWQLAGNAGLISAEFLPTPLSIARAFGDLLVTGEFTHHLGVSMGRAAIGFLIGGVLGLLFGVVTGLFRTVEYVLDPSVQVLRLVPHLAIAPLIILWFGFGEISKVVIIMTGSFFPLYVNTFMGIRNVDNKLFEVARVLGFSPYQKLRRLIIPAALPGILLGLRLSMAVAWIGLVVAELIGSQSGIGFLINEAKQNSNTEIVFVGIIIFAIVGKLIDSLFRIIERKFLFWRDSYKG